MAHMFGRDLRPNHLAQYPYLEAEDGDFAHGHRLTEDDFLKAFGGLAAYQMFVQDRLQARKLAEVPRLPSELNLARHRELQKAGMSLTERDSAMFELKELRQKVQGILDGEVAASVIRAQGEAWQKAREDERKRELQRLKEEGSQLFGWGVNSQSAADYATEQLDRIKHGLRR